MGKQTGQRKRRSASEMQPMLDKWEPAFEPWLYAGNPEQMKKYLFKGKIHKLEWIKKGSDNQEQEEPDGQSCRMKEVEYDELKEINKVIGHDYFQTIPPEVWSNPEIIRQYGKNLRAVRKKMKRTGQEVADAIGIFQQDLSSIEAGHRKKIDRNILVLLCGYFKTPPEFLLGLVDPRSVRKKDRKTWTGVRVSKDQYVKKGSQFPKHSEKIRMTAGEKIEHPRYVKVHVSKQLQVAMDFDTDWSMMRCRYILDQLSTGNEALLKILIHVADCPGRVQKKLLQFLKSMPGLHMMNAKTEESMVQEYQKGAEQRFPKKWWNPTHSISSLTNLEKSTPELLSAYVSIARQDPEMWERLYQILDSAGFGEI